VSRRRIALAAILVAGAVAALTLALNHGDGHKSVTKHSERLSVSINAPSTTPAWLVALASRKAHQVTKSAPTTGVIEKQRLTYEVRLQGDFTWLACDPCAKRGPLPVAIQHFIVFRVDPASRRVVSGSGPPSLFR
jgi:hypothetical protein